MATDLAVAENTGRCFLRPSKGGDGDEDTLDDDDVSAADDDDDDDEREHDDDDDDDDDDICLLFLFPFHCAPRHNLIGLIGSRPDY